MCRWNFLQVARQFVLICDPLDLSGSFFSCECLSRFATGRSGKLVETGREASLRVVTFDGRGNLELASSITVVLNSLLELLLALDLRFQNIHFYFKI